MTTTLDEYHCFRSCESVLKAWHKQANHSHGILYPRAQNVGLHHRKKRVLEHWFSKLAHQKLKAIEWDRMTKNMGRDNTLKWILRRWRAGARAIQIERREEEEVVAKWKEVRAWLGDA